MTHHRIGAVGVIRPIAAAFVLATMVVVGACGISADDHPRPISRESTTTTIGTGPEPPMTHVERWRR